MVDFANPCDYDSWQRTHLFYWSLGAYGSTHVYTWADSYESAEETMLEWVDDNAPGLLSTIGEAELRESAQELGIEYDPQDIDDRIIEHAEQDMIIVGHTTLKHGNAIPSWEVHVREVTGDTRKRAIATSKAICERDDAPNLPALQANRSGIAPLVVGALVAGGLAWWFLKSKEAKASTPTKQACPITLEMLTSYVKTKPTNYKLYLPPDTSTQPVAAWPPAKPDYLANPNEHAFSLVDCGFYKWDGTKWVSDEAENTALATYLKATVVKGPPMLAGHPTSLFLF